jgi:hypothetical protein
LAEKQPKTDIERIACLAYYLRHFRDAPFFKTKYLSSLNTEAAQQKFSNAAYAGGNCPQSWPARAGSEGATPIERRR